MSDDRIQNIPATGNDLNARSADDALVSIIVPAYNAEDYIRETLESALAQTYSNFEIIVVDDGSTDDTADIVAKLAARDRRICLLRQENAGVAAARNLAIGQARGSLIAPLDADDIWHPAKIAKQVAVMREGGKRMGLVYCWTSTIDKESCIVNRQADVRDYEGDVFAALILYNIVGSASVPLIRRQSLIEAGGYDTGLRARCGQGCEDLKLNLTVAERYDFGVVREFLVGYRTTPTQMSRDTPQMRRSFQIVIAEARERHRELPNRLFRWSKTSFQFAAARRCLRGGDLSKGVLLLCRTILSDPTFPFRELFLRHIRNTVRNLIATASHHDRRAGDELNGRKFLDVPSDEPDPSRVRDDRRVDSRQRSAVRSMRIRRLSPIDDGAGPPSWQSGG